MEIFETPLKYLNVTGIWFEKEFTRKRLVFCAFMHLIFAEVIMVLLIVHLIGAESLQKFSDGMASIPTFVGLFIKSLNLTLKRNKIESVMESLKNLMQKDDWIAKSKSLKLQKRLSIIKRVFKVSLAMFMIASLTIPIDAFFTRKPVLDLWLPYDFKASEFRFWTLIIYQTMSGLIYSPVLVICDLFPMFFISFVTGLIEELCCRVEIITNNSALFSRAQKLKELKKCIEIHKEIKTLLMEIKDIFGIMIWSQGFMGALILCTNTFSMTLVSLK
jgi:hypothetical protein